METAGSDNRHLRIAMVIDAYDDSKNGAVISTKRFVEFLRNDYTVSIITTGAPGEGKIILPKFYAPFVDGIMRKMKTPLAVPFNYILRSAIQEHSLIHVQFPFYLGVRAIHFARKFNIPVVTTFHIQAEHLAMNAGIRSDKFIQFTYHYWMNHIYNQSDRVICPTQFAKEELIRYGLTRPATIISNGILPVFQPDSSIRGTLFPGKFIILSVGRYAPEKRHDLIISAIDQSKYRDTIQLILIGDGPMKEKLIARSKCLPNPVLFLTLEQEELIYYYNLAHLYIHAATVEVECMTVLEAIACGLPPLIANSKKSATPKFALDDRSLFESLSQDDLKQKMEYWIEHPDELTNAGGSYILSSAKYRIEYSVTKLKEVYHQLIANRVQKQTDSGAEIFAN